MYGTFNSSGSATPQPSTESVAQEQIDIASIFGANVKQLRKGRKWSKEKLSDKADVSLDVIKRVEKGLGTKVDAAYKIAKALDTTLDSLFGSSSEDSTVSPDRVMENLRALEKSIKEMFQLGE